MTFTARRALAGSAALAALCALALHPPAPPPPTTGVRPVRAEVQQGARTAFPQRPPRAHQVQPAAEAAVDPAPEEPSEAPGEPSEDLPWQGFVRSVDDLLALTEARRPELLAAVAQPLEALGGDYAFGPRRARAKGPSPIAGELPRRFEDPLRVHWRERTLEVQPQFGRGSAQQVGDALVYGLEDGVSALRVPMRDRVEELLILESPAQLGELSYRIATDPPFAAARMTPAGSVELVEDETAGAAYLRLNPVEAMDAERELIAGAWELETQPDGTLLARLDIDLSDAAFPVAIDPGWSATGSLLITRLRHSLTTLSDGDVLAVGDSALGSSISERYDVDTGTWSLAGVNTRQRGEGHSATLLDDGRVLVVGADYDAELYDPVTNDWTATAPVRVPNGRRESHTATILADGRVLVAGGSTGNNDALSHCELYDPDTNAWTQTDSLDIARQGHTATRLDDGRVLVAGGYLGASAWTTSCELFDPATEQWSATGSFPPPARNAHTANLLPDGRVFICGGQESGFLTGTTRIYQPASGTWTLGPGSAVQRYGHQATSTAGGAVLVSGGQVSGTSYTASAQLFDPMGNSFSTLEPLPALTAYHAAALLPNGLVLVSGGAVAYTGFYQEVKDCYLYSEVDVPEPSALEQLDTSGTIVPLNGSVDEDAIRIRGVVSAPGGEPVRLDVEVRPYPDAFTGTPSASSPQVASGGQASVDVSGLADGPYHWRARAVTAQGLQSPWSWPHEAAGVPSFTVDTVLPPVQLSELAQLEADGTTPIALGGSAAADALVLRARVTLPGGVGNATLEVEVQPLGSAFTGAASGSSTVASGSLASIALSGLAPGSYHWRAVATSSTHPPAPASSFGANPESEADFVIPEPPPPCHHWDFEAGLAGWTVDGPFGGVGWATDGTPASVPGGAAQSGNASLNYNDGVDYDNGSKNLGAATSPAIDLSIYTSAELSFACNYQTETTGTSWDRRILNVLDAQGTIVHYQQFSTTAGGCAAMGTWHTHVVTLDPAWGEVRIRFGFDTIDGIGNQFDGWFLDDVDVCGTGGPPPPPPGVRYATDFSDTSGWTLSAPAGGVGWAGDATPANAPAGPTRSAPASLNYNDGIDYDSGAANAGSATSPAIAIGDLNQPRLRFWCNYHTETGGTSWDRRHVRVSSDGFQSLLHEEQFSAANGCTGMGLWHQHEVLLQPAWGSIQVRFAFDTVDSVLNAHSGWFLDDLEVLDAAPAQ